MVPSTSSLEQGEGLRITNRTSFFLVFIVDAATTAVLGLAILFGLPGGRRVLREGAGWGEALRHLRTNRPFLGTVAASFCIAIVFW